MFENDLTQAQKSALLKQLFAEFQEFVAITLYVNGEELATVYDLKSLEAAGLTKESLLDYRQAHQPSEDLFKTDRPVVMNSTLTAKLPTFTIMMPLQPQTDQLQRAAVAAVIRLDGLQRLATRSKVFTTFIADFEGIPLAHSDSQKVVDRSQIGWITDVKGLKRQQSHGTTREHIQDDVQMVGGLARIESSDLLAGVEIPKAAAYLAARELLNNLIIVALVLLIMSVIVSLFGARLITEPLVRLSGATRVVAKGQYDIQLESSSRDEIDDLAQSFNQMASELDSREKALKGAQAALVQSEKMAAFGQLGAGIAHEIKNPLAGILGLTQLSLRKIEKESALAKNLNIIEKETNRCTAIIQNLLKFARQEKVSFEAVEVNRVVNDAVAIVEHQLEMNRVTLKKNLAPELPIISGNANQIQQVLINLMINAQQAMEGRAGEVSITTSNHDSGHLQIQVRDTGPGIPDDQQAKIFEPFFTTKEVGKGTGLGLSVSYGIIKEHGGDIMVKSAVGKGTAFLISLPLKSLDTICPRCKKTYKIKPSSLGRTDKCRNCGTVFKLEAH
jgi:signal transduction histidine kinase